jgi:arylsulfatase A-like enzyme
MKLPSSVSFVCSVGQAWLGVFIAVVFAAALQAASDLTRPHIVLVMADDMGWGQTSYNGHPVLKTPHLDAMAAAGLRLDRFYAGAPNCSPTRATVMTGRSNDRAGVENHGFALRRQERTVARALRDAGYVTGHFGKWHLNGYRGPGAPILGTDTHHPGSFGFDEWLPVTNFFDRNPLLSRQGKFEELKGDSSEIVVAEALKFIERQRPGGKPTFTVIWYGSPHSPMIASAEDKQAFAALNASSQNHYGELVAMDRSIGALRAGLRQLGLAENTLVWFCSDNGGLPEITPETVGGLRGFKNTVYEGGLRVPAIIEWPAVIRSPRRTSYPAGTVDIFPTLAEITRLPASALLSPVDGSSLKALFTAEIGERAKPLPFRHQGRAAWIDNRYKLVAPSLANGTFELYDLVADPKETRDISAEQPEVARRMRDALLAWNESVKASVAGKDYPEGRLLPGDPASRDWSTAPEYQTYLREWQQRPEFSSLGKAAKKKKG